MRSNFIDFFSLFWFNSFCSFNGGSSKLYKYIYINYLKINLRNSFKIFFLFDLGKALFFLLLTTKLQFHVNLGKYFNYEYRSIVRGSVLPCISNLRSVAGVKIKVRRLNEKKKRLIWRQALSFVCIQTRGFN